MFFSCYYPLVIAFNYLEMFLSALNTFSAALHSNEKFCNLRNYFCLKCFLFPKKANLSKKWKMHVLEISSKSVSIQFISFHL